MRGIVLISAVLICGSLFVGCSRKPAQTAAPCLKFSWQR